MSQSSPVTALLVLGVVFAMAWLYSVHTHPYASCKFCGGRGYFRHPVFVWAKRPCTHCERGSVRRFGAKRR